VGIVIELLLLTIFIVGITAFLGVITNSLGEWLFSRSSSREFIVQTKRTQQNWNKIHRIRK
jgi:hypothetical protein